MLEQIKQLRVEIDGLAQLCEGLKPIQHQIYNGSDYLVPAINSNEILEAVKSLKLAKAWLGKVLEGLGSENPYGSGYKTVEDIIPETDKISLVDKMRPYSNYVNNFKYKSHIEKVDWLRNEIKKIWDTIVKLDCSEYDHLNFDLEIDNLYTKLTEASFWLGFELGRIRDESKK